MLACPFFARGGSSGFAGAMEERRHHLLQDHTPRAGVTIGPQYGTVGGSYIKDVAREATRAGDIDLLCVLAFAFDPQVVGAGDDGYITAEDGFASVAAGRRLGSRCCWCG